MPTTPPARADEPRRTIAIDTSTATGSVAAVGEGLEIVERLAVSTEHARLVAPAVRSVAERAGWPLASIDCIAVVRGPGSFTGLRVGVTTAKTFAWTLGIRLVGVSAVDAIARGIARAAAGRTSRLSIAFDAGRGEVHASDLRLDDAGVIVVVGEPGLQTAASWIDSRVAGTIVAGPALEKLSTAVAARGDLVIADPVWWHPSPTAVAESGLARARAGTFDDPWSLVPEYIRPSYAEEARRPNGG